MNQSAHLGHGRGLRVWGAVAGQEMRVLLGNNRRFEHHKSAELRFHKLPKLAPPLTAGQLGDNVPITFSILVPVAFEVNEVANGDTVGRR